MPSILKFRKRFWMNAWHMRNHKILAEPFRLILENFTRDNIVLNRLIWPVEYDENIYVFTLNAGMFD